MSVSKSSVQDFDGAQPDESEKSLSLMGGVVGPEGLPEASDLDVLSGEKRSLSQGTLLLLILVVVAAAAIFAMRSTQSGMSGPATAKDVEARIEQALAKLSRPDAMPSDDPLARKNLDTLFQNTDSIVTMFATDISQRQVPIEFVKQNPFVMPSFHPVAVPVGDVNQAPVHDETQRRKLLTEIKDLKLQTVMRGRVPIAIISGQFVQPGQSIGSFTVKSIRGLTVVLESNGESYTLTMEEKPTAAGQGSGQR